MTRIKYCGLTGQEEVDLAAELDIDLVGFVVLAPRSHRDLPAERAAELIEQAPVELETVLVTPETEPGAVHRAVETAGPDIVQLTGVIEDDLPRQVQRKHGVQVWRAFHAGLDLSREEDRLRDQAETCDAIILDAVDSDGYGGHGDPLNWQHARDLVDALHGFPVVLAGGLDADNVAEAIDWVHPWCVDVSSGIEVDGRKDPDRMAAFADAVHDV